MYLKHVIRRALREQQRGVVDIRDVEHPVGGRRRCREVKIDDAVCDRLTVDKHIVSVLIHERLGKRQLNPVGEVAAVSRNRARAVAVGGVARADVVKGRHLVAVDEVEELGS